MRNGPPALPMLATLAEPPVSQKGLVYEPKYDGIRAIVEIKDAGRPFSRPQARAGKRTPGVLLYSRNGNDKTAQFPEIVQALEAIAARLPAPVVLDGEIVAVDHD